MTGAKKLAELVAGDTIASHEGHRRWLLIVEIGALRNVEVPGAEYRNAVMEYTGGARAGHRFPMQVYGYTHGWEVR